MKSNKEFVDTSEWKEFVIGKLFDFCNSKPYHNKDVEKVNEQSDNTIAYITRTKFNNGLNSYVVNKDRYIINPAGTISFGAENANFFYQFEPYITGNKMYYIDTRGISSKAALFLVSVLEHTFTHNFNYNKGLIPKRIENEKILLPADINGNPDWDYMETFMSKIIESERERE